MSQSELKRILYVEDDESIAEVVLMTLEDFGGFEVKHCDRGQKALDVVVEYQPDLILMDVMMPSIDGPTTMQRMKTMDGVKHVPVVFMTAKAQTHEQQEYLDKGAKAVLVKPFDPMSLCDQIREIWASCCQTKTG